MIGNNGEKEMQPKDVQTGKDKSGFGLGDPKIPMGKSIDHLLGKATRPK